MTAKATLPALSVMPAQRSAERASIPKTPLQEPAAGFPLTRCALAGMTRMTFAWHLLSAGVSSKKRGAAGRSGAAFLLQLKSGA
jgi:hypothetical protein